MRRTKRSNSAAHRAAAQRNIREKRNRPVQVNVPGRRRHVPVQRDHVVVDELLDEGTLAHDLGVTQIDFHGGRKALRFGDCRPNPELHPDGLPSVKRMVDRLRDAIAKTEAHGGTFRSFNRSGVRWPGIRRPG